MEQECVVGCLVRAEWKGHRAVVGPIVGQSHNGTCWVIKTHKGEVAFHKSHCRRIQSNEAGVRARTYKQVEKVKLNLKARATLQQAGLAKIYGDGDI